MTYNTCVFFGHRLILAYNKVYKALKEEIKKLILSGVTRFIVGTHGDFDKIALTVCKELKKNCNYIKIELVYTSFNKLTKEEEISNIKSNKDIEIITYEIEQYHYKRKIIESNKMMVDDSDIVLCFVNEDLINSGAKLAVKYARKKNKKVINLYGSIK